MSQPIALPATRLSDTTLGLWLGLLGVVVVALTAAFGWELLLQLGKFALTVVIALAIHMFVVLPIWVRTMGAMKPAAFFKNSEEALLTAFATASSTRWRSELQSVP